MLRGRTAVCCCLFLSFTSPQCTILLLLLSPLLWILITSPVSLPQRGYSFQPRCPLSVTISETLCTAYKVTFMLCSMLKWSVHRCKNLQYVWTALAKGSFRTQRKLEENSDGEKPAPTGKGNKRCLNELLMDCCKMTVRALLTPCGITSPERQCFNEPLISLLYMLISNLTHRR